MAKKTVLIADQTTQKRKVFTMRKDSDTGVNLAADNSKIGPNKSGQNMSFGTNMYISGKPYVPYLKSTREVKTGYGNV